MAFWNNNKDEGGKPMDMYGQAQLFEQAAQEDGLKYDRVEGGDRPHFSVAFGGGDFAYQHLVVHVIMDADGKSAQFVSSPVAHAQEDKMAQMMLACNQSNARFRWIKFYLDSDNDVMAEADAVLDEVSGGKECVEIVRRMASIVDAAYPDFMKAAWA